MKFVLLLFKLCFFNCCFGQSLPATPAAARTGIYRKAQGNAFHFMASQAALGRFKKFSAAVYGENRALLQELSLFQLALVQPVDAGAFGAQLSHFGNADYNASKIGAAYGRNLSERLAAGVQFNYLNQHIRGYGNAAQVTVEGAVSYQFSDAFGAGFQLSNPAGAVFNKTIEKEPAVYTAGFTCQPSQQFGITAELSKTGKAPMALQTGFEYQFSETLRAKAGINSGTAAFFVAAGFSLKNFSIETVGSVHAQLGFSPGLMLLYNGMGK